MAASFRGQAGVEYAQAAYVNHAMLVPNDPLYKTLQWNLPLIDLERAWDIQPRAGSNITVAVLDTGVAYTDATVNVNVLGFKDDQGNQYPALGDVTIRILGRVATGDCGPLRVSARLRLGYDDAARFRRSRHARQRDHRPVDQRRHWHGRSRV